MDLHVLTPRSLVNGLRRRLKKSLGQNFLIDENVTRSIAREAESFNPGHILEIGPGAGALTLALCSLGHPVAVLEKDDHCADYVRNIFAQHPGFEVIHGDALTAPLPDFCTNPSDRPLLVSNLPYNAASQIYFRFIDADLPLLGMVLMFQREAAERFLAHPSTGAYGSLSVIGQYYHEIERVMDVPPSAFCPAPKVTSTVLRFTPRRRSLGREDEARLRDLVRAAFAMRRKTLANSLNSYAGFDKNAWAQKIENIGRNPNDRAENLSLGDYIRLLGMI